MSEDHIEREMPPLKTPEVIVNRAEFEALKAENAKLREALDAALPHVNHTLVRGKLKTFAAKR